MRVSLCWRYKTVAGSRQLFSQKAPSENFDTAFNAPSSRQPTMRNRNVNQTQAASGGVL